MASSPSTPYSFTSKTYQSAGGTSHNPLPKHQYQHRNSSTATTIIRNPIPAASSIAAGTRSVSPSSSTCHKDVILEPKPSFLPYYPQNSNGILTPEFRRNRTTRVISKRNFSSPKPFNGNNRMGSAAAFDCLTQILQSPPTPDGCWAINSILSEFGRSLVAPDDYCFILSELGDRDKCPTRALNFFRWAMPLMRGPTQQGKLLTAAIGGFGRIFCPDIARQVFDEGVKFGYANTIFAYSAMISAYARSGLAAEAMDTLEAMKGNGLKPTTITYNAVIDACGKGGVSIQFTLGFFRQMLHEGLCPDRKTFNSLLAACSRAGHLEDALVMFDEMIRLGIGRDIYTYNTFIDAICKCGNMKLAVQVMSDMPANNVPPNVVTYSTLMDGYSKLEQFDEALKLYDEMKALRIQLDRVCYNTLLVVYVKTGKYEEIVKVCEEMDATRVEKDTVTYNSLINGYGKQGRFEMVSYLIQEMRERGVPPSVLTYSTLIDIYSKAGMYVDAANVFMEFKKSGLKADVVLYSSFIDTLAKNGLVDCAVWLLDEMTRLGIEPNVVTYNTIIDAFGKSNIAIEDADVGNEIVGLEGSGGQIVRAFSQLARGVGRPVLDEARRRSEELLCILGLFQKMVQQGVKPNVVTFSAILNACSRCDSFEDASVLLEQLRLFDNFVYGVAHGLLMGHREVWAQAQSLFDELRRMDPSTSSAFYNALTDMLWHFGQRRGAQQVVLEGVQRHVWENTWSEFTLDLHLMSVGASQAMVHAWLLTIRAIVFEGREIPEVVSILTGWGKHSKVAGASTLRRVTEVLLESVGAPFQLEKFNVGRFVSRGAMLAAWLKKAGTINLLLLHDERVQPASPLNLLPRLQALQL